MWRWYRLALEFSLSDLDVRTKRADCWQQRGLYAPWRFTSCGLHWEDLGWSALDPVIRKKHWHRKGCWEASSVSPLGEFEQYHLHTQLQDSGRRKSLIIQRRKLPICKCHDNLHNNLWTLVDACRFWEDFKAWISSCFCHLQTSWTLIVDLLLRYFSSDIYLQGICCCII